MKTKIKPCKLYALEHDGVIRHKDAFGKELKVGDYIAIGGFRGVLYRGVIEGCTPQRIVYKVYYEYGNSYSSFLCYIDKNKVCKYK